MADDAAAGAPPAAEAAASGSGADPLVDGLVDGHPAALVEVMRANGL